MATVERFYDFQELLKLFVSDPTLDHLEQLSAVHGDLVSGGGLRISLVYFFRWWLLGPACRAHVRKCGRRP